MSSLVVLLALSEQQAFAVDIHVPADQPTLASAITVARPADTIVLDTNISENVILNGLNRTIRGAVAQTQLGGTVTLTNGAQLTLMDITVQNGDVETDLAEIQLGNLCNRRGAGISVVDSTLTLDNATLVCMSPALIAIDSTLDITDSTFRYNVAPTPDGAGALQAVDTDVFVGNTNFELNTGYPAGAISVTEQGNPGGTTATIQTSDFTNNSSSGGPGGAIYARVGTLNVYANEFLNNYNLVYFTPGISLADALALGIDITGLLVGLGDGAGLYVDEGSGAVDVWNNTFCGNIADAGGGVYINNVEGAGVYNNRFAENWSVHYGGGIYVEADQAYTDPVRVVNNTFLYNTAGLLPPPNTETVVAIGAGGAGAFVNTVVDFRNNIVALTQFGAGLMGVARDLGVTLEGADSPDYTIGDLLTIDFNDFYHNCDVRGCAEDDGVDFSGDLSQISLPATNIALDPFPVYFGGGEFNCFPDAFYPDWESPVVRAGDAVNEPNRFDPNFSDMGAYGGPRADVLDRDGDGYENIYDCNDEVGGGQVHPDAPEICDGFDNDCDGDIDEGFETTWYEDSDGDGYGDVEQVQPRIQCTAPPNHVLNREDCDDGDDTINPGSSELCDGLDNDCDGVADSNLAFLPLYQDRDGDDYGAGAQANGCLAQDDNAGPGVYYILNEDGTLTLKVGGYVENTDDCNDFEPNIHPGAPDVCDNVDNDCDGTVDNGTDGTRYLPDADGDGFGNPDDDLSVFACSTPGPGYVEDPGAENLTDCDDGNDLINPNADEVCDDVDNDCNGTADKNAVDAAVLFEDLDGDGLGNPARVSTDCVPPAGYTAKSGTDCDDTDPNIAECAAACGCQSMPTPGSAGSVGLVMSLAIFGLRRRRA